MPRERRSGVPSLTGIRGVAAVWVLLHHLNVPLTTIFPVLSHSSFLQNGFRAVDLFFILSGFILMRAHGSDFARLTVRHLKQFWLARALRVYPLNTVVLLALIPVVLFLPDYVSYDRIVRYPAEWYRVHNLSWPGFVQSLLLVQTFTVKKLGEWNGPAWSLSAEMLGYALFPLLAFWAMRCREPLGCILGAVASLFVLVVLSSAAHYLNGNPTGSFGVIRMFFCFGSGILLERARDLLPSLKGMGAAISYGGLAAVAATLAIPGLSILSLFGFGLLILGLSFQEGRVDAFLRSAPCMWLGKISFSFYMVQETLFRIFLWRYGQTLSQMPPRTYLLALVAYLAATLLLSYLLYETVERPSHRFGKWLQGGQREGALPALAHARR